MHAQRIGVLEDRFAGEQDVMRGIEIAVMARAALGAAPVPIAQAQVPVQMPTGPRSAWSRSIDGALVSVHRVYRLIAVLPPPLGDLRNLLKPRLIAPDPIHSQPTQTRVQPTPTGDQSPVAEEISNKLHAVIALLLRVDPAQTHGMLANRVGA